MGAPAQAGPAARRKTRLPSAAKRSPLHRSQSDGEGGDATIELPVRQADTLTIVTLRGIVVRLQAVREGDYTPKE